MQTHFSEQQRAIPAIQIADAVLRKCVHCGFCTATCPTYRLTGDERESPRGRISLIQNLLETEQSPTAETVANLDHCLSCLACESTCPSGVSYRRLIDQGRELIEAKYRRPLADRLSRQVLAWLLPRRNWFERSLWVGRLSRPLLMFAGRYSRQIAAVAELLPEHAPDRSASIGPGIYPAEGEEIKRVVLITGCVQSVLAPEIDAASVRLLTRHGCTVVVPTPAAAGCCGALPHHLGKASQAQQMAQQNMNAWGNLITTAGANQAIDAIVMTASGCGTMLKDYSHVLAGNKEAESLSLLIKDLSVIINELFKLKSPSVAVDKAVETIVGWQSPCSLQHGLQEKSAPIEALQACGFTVREPRDAHLCCGSAGTYNLLQPSFARQLRDDKVDKLRAISPAIIASGNIGCITFLKAAANLQPAVAVVHIAQLLDWATGGPKPDAIT